MGFLAVPLASVAAKAQSLPASPASSTEKPGKEETAPKEDQSGLIITASSRARYESVDGRPRPGFASAEDAFLLRTGVAIEYRRGPFAVGGELIDSRAYDIRGKSQIGRDDVNAVELPQAYVKFRLDGVMGTGSKFAVQGGRFLLNLGSGRLVATDEYRNTVNGFTGLQVEVDPDRDTAFVAFYVLPQERQPDTQDDVRRNVVRFDRETFDDVFFGAFLRRKQLIGAAQAEFAYYRLVEHDSLRRETADRRLNVIDARINRDPKAKSLDFDLEGVYQFGHGSDSTMITATKAKVSSGFVHVAAGYTFDHLFNPRLGFFYDYASGDKRGGKFNRFDTLFGSRRDDLGPSGTYGGVARENISAPGVRFEAKPGKRLEVLADYRAIWLASRYDRFYNVTDKTGTSGNFAGQQLSGRLRYWVLPQHIRVESNFALLFKGAFLKTARQALARDRDMVRFLEVNVQMTF